MMLKLARLFEEIRSRRPGALNAVNVWEESMRDLAGRLLTIVAVVSVCSSGAFAGQQPTGAKYQVVKVCSLLTLAEFKKIDPWPPYLDSLAKAKEEPIGPQGSSCNYPGADIQVMSFSRSMIDTAKKGGGLEPVSGVGDEAYVHNNQDRYAELYARVGPHLLTVQLDIPTGKTFDARKPTLIELGKTFAAKLR